MSGRGDEEGTAQAAAAEVDRGPSTSASEDADASSDGSDESSDSPAGSASLYPSRHTLHLNGHSWSFENTIPLVLAAARQLRIPIARNARLLWIADEALLDQYSEEEAAALQSVPSSPLSAEVERYYSNLFAERSEDVKLKVEPAVAEDAASLAALEQAIAEKRARSRRERKKERRAERRRSLALREARLSNITERYTQEVEAIDELAAAGGGSPHHPLSPRAAVWPADVSGGGGGGGGVSSRLPRIESATMSLDQMGQAEEAAEAAPTPAFALGDRVEVDFDDEGWFKGEVSAHEWRDGAAVYQVKLDMGEFADSVVGSEIRAERVSAEGGSESSCEQVAHTRSDALSGFDALSVGDELSEASMDEELQMHCRLTDRGVDWSFIAEERVTWSHPTLSSLRAHDDRYPRWEAAKPGL
ncbi:hypothetical protein AB1Y20_007396 [Prymnesium parvum]|uniref:Uncharacterized protein n=1 Tax=Prymnesium parvum TaxID=97485 RepID=A0AB34IXE9_PRYPA